MKTIIKKLAGLSFLLLLGTVKIYAATHTVTNSNDAGANSLRQLISNAAEGDTIIFADNVSQVNLTGDRILVVKPLFIIGGANKTTIKAGTGSIFNSLVYLNIKNLILTGANIGVKQYGNWGGAISSGGILIADNCEFTDNIAVQGGAIYSSGTLRLTNCVFKNNSTTGSQYSIKDGVGGAVYASKSKFTADNCAFINNSSKSYGGAVFFTGTDPGEYFVATNCTFRGNTANISNGGGAIAMGTFMCMGYNTVRVSLYHCTIDSNRTSGSAGGAIYGTPNSTEYFVDRDTAMLHIYNCIVTGNTPTNNQIQLEQTTVYLYGYDDNLIEGNGITRNLVFGNNQFHSTLNCIFPIEYAKSATKLNNTIQVPNGITVAEILAKLTTDQIGIKRPDAGFVTFGAVEVIPTDVKFYIRASEHPLTDPRSRNYPIPIFIKADKDIGGAIIDSLVIEIDIRIFYPRTVDNGEMKLRFADTIIKMTFENVVVPLLRANEEKLLLNIFGDVLLGEIDSSEIKIDTVKFAKDLTEEPELIHGFITLDICIEGGARFTWFDYNPAIILKNNPVSEMLEIECKTIENGDYSLEIVDMLGKSETVREFTVSASGKRIFDFEIPISNFSSGAYFIIMNTPTSKYSAGFVVQ